MTSGIRTARRTSYPALMLFGLVYVATLAIVFAPESLRGGSFDHSLPQSKGGDDVLLRP